MPDRTKQNLRTALKEAEDLVVAMEAVSSAERTPEAARRFSAARTLKEVTATAAMLVQTRAMTAEQALSASEQVLRRVREEGADIKTRVR
jgi:hypothetical protein